MSLRFEPIRFEDQRKYLEILHSGRWEASDYSFMNIWAWAGEYGLEWAWDDHLVWIRQTRPHTVYWAPLGRWDSVDWNAVFTRGRGEKFFAPAPEGTAFTRVPEALVKRWRDVWSDGMNATPAEEHWDYLYAVPELIALKGNRFHKKKNLLNQFKKLHPDHLYVPLDSPSLIRQAADMQETWCHWRDCESEATLEAENRVIEKTLSAWDDLEGLFGGAIFVDDAMAAFTIAEAMSDDTLIIHFEKGLGEFKGIYQAINQMFLSANDRFAYVNREQDLGDPGLRKAKRSYNPVDFVRKYTVTFPGR